MLKIGVIIKAALLVIVPYLLGIFVSPRVVPLDYFQNRDGAEASIQGSLNAKIDSVKKEINVEDTSWTEDHPDSLYLDKLVDLANKGDPFAELSFVIHRNGEAEPCGRSIAPTGIFNAFREAMKDFEFIINEGGKYELDSFLTGLFANFLLPFKSCSPFMEDSGTEKNLWSFNKEEPKTPQFPIFCDMGADRTPILPDHKQLVPLSQEQKEHNLPCHFHTREGLRVTSLEQLVDLARNATKQESCVSDENEENKETCSSLEERELHLYAVPAGRVFHFAPSYVGEIFDLSHVSVPNGLPVSLEVMSLNPRVFDVKNFFSKEESSDIVQRALAENTETHRMKRSSTGASGYNINPKRTSDNGFDTHGETAMALKRRSFEVLGFDEYHESFADGLQVLRYNKTNAYTTHLDWIDDPSTKEEHNYDSAGVGTNRFATIFLYMSDLPENGGGETVFPKGWPPGESGGEHVDFDKSLENVRKELSGFVKEGSWEESLIAECRSKLAVRPQSARAILFYSQHPDGVPDQASLHGACPVISGKKWAANLWVWNGPRSGFPGSPVNQEVVERNLKNGQASAPSFPNQLHATFSNAGTDPKYEHAELFFQDTFWGKLGHGDPPLGANTFEGHEWYVRVNGEVVEKWVIDDRKEQFFEL